MRSNLALPVAIVVAGACIGAGLYFGLRARTPPAPEGPPNVDAPAQQAVLEAKPNIAARCWKPTAPNDAAQVALDLAFAADGSQIALGIIQDRGAKHPELARCITELGLQLRIPPPGRPAHARVLLALP